MARCKKCNSFSMFPLKNGLCKKCVKIMEADPYEQYGSHNKIFHFDKPRDKNLDEINEWLKRYTFSYLMISDFDEAISTDNYCAINDMELECVKEAGKELYLHRIIAVAFTSYGRDADAKTEEEYRETILAQYPGAQIMFSRLSTYTSGKCSLVILIRTKA